MLFSTLQELEEIAIQSRHTYARLIHLGALPEIVWNDDARIGRAEGGSLHFRTDRWGPTWGRLAVCECCDSPGHVEIQNARGGDVLQVCATATTSTLAWAACLAKLAAPATETANEVRLTGFPLLPGDLHPLREPVDILPTLLAALGREEAAVRFLLHTPEVAHLREFIPRHLIGEYPLMVATDFRTTLQLALPPVQRLACGSDLSLHLAGPGNTLLLSLAAAEAHEPAWRDALAATFPSIRSFLSTP
ncbi:MAG: hypothetical protein WDM96_10640 [Lacunisphaera sp.]